MKRISAFGWLKRKAGTQEVLFVAETSLVERAKLTGMDHHDLWLAGIEAHELLCQALEPTAEEIVSDVRDHITQNLEV